MYLILSSAYVVDELQAEFGKIPPVALPLGNKYLLDWQLKATLEFGKVYLTLPTDYEVGTTFDNLIQKMDVKVIRLSENLSVGEAILKALEEIEFSECEELRIQHGDTLFESIPDVADSISASTLTTNYKWACIQQGCDDLLVEISQRTKSTKIVSSGYYSFSDVAGFRKELTSCRADFLKAINQYNKKNRINVENISSSHDFGHVATYYKSKGIFTTQRSFNTLNVTSHTVTKRSVDDKKVSAEARWFQELPSSLKVYSPQLISVSSSPGDVSYTLAYEHLSTLSELLVFGKLPIFVWKKILNCCFEYLLLETAHSFDNPVREDLCEFVLRKSWARVAMANELEFARELLERPVRYLDSAPVTAIQMLEHTSPELRSCATHLQCWTHGDFCFSNILYDFRSEKILTIDPRGISEDGNRIQDISYDLVKLAHSIIGRYDLIISGSYQIVRDENRARLVFDLPPELRILEDFLLKHYFSTYQITKKSLYAHLIHLFISMIPLHADRPDRQIAFLLNATRLFCEMNKFK